MNKSGIIVLMVFLMLACQGYAQFSQGQIIQAGISQVNAGNFKSAAQLFLLGAALYPNNPLFPYNYAVVLYVTDNNAEAAEKLQEVIQKFPDYFRAYSLLAQIYIRSNQLSLAKNTLEKGIEQVPNNALLYGDLGYVYFLENDFEKAQEYLRESIKLDPKMPKPYFHLGLILRRTKEYSESEKMFKKAIELDSEYANAYNSLGVLYQEIGQIEKALEYYSKAIDLDPSLATAYNNYATILTDLGRLEEAQKFVERALKLDPNNAAFYEQYGNIFAFSGNSILAKIIYRHALSLDNTLYLTRINLALLLSIDQEYEEAVKVLRQLINLYPDAAEPYNRMGLYLKRLERQDESEKFLKKAIQLQPQNGQFLLDLAILYQEQQKIQDAIRYYELSLRYDPKPAAYNNLGIIYRNQGQFMKAEQTFKKAIQIDASYALGYLNLAVLYEDQNRNAQADTMYKKGIEVAPENVQYLQLYVQFLMGQGRNVEAAKYERIINSLR